MHPWNLDIANVSFHYAFSRDNALENISLRIEAGTLTGLLGRNGSGKSTLGMLIAAQAHPSHGSILVNGATVWENAEAMAGIALVSDDTPVFKDSRTEETLKLWAASRPQWDDDWAHTLLDAFGISTRKKPKNMSRGQKSALFASLGLAARTPITIFDEVHLGMDAVAREIFYRALLKDFTAHPRTILISSHLIEEIESLLDHVILLDHGHVIEAGDADDVRARHTKEGDVPSLTDVLMDLTMNDAQRQLIGQ
ncbi:MAG: ABC transporter ATP-binding protein [Actinomycetaceae bacterium]|nr:ABC transporter ATP-binding protein [Actinomycetaceae bacterium]MDY6082884.1 ABC transporter ATP-binding protein [Actinomycetaceae bacterium]